MDPTRSHWRFKVFALIWLSSNGDLNRLPFLKGMSEKFAPLFAICPDGLPRMRISLCFPNLFCHKWLQWAIVGGNQLFEFDLSHFADCRSCLFSSFVSSPNRIREETSSFRQTLPLSHLFPCLCPVLISFKLKTSFMLTSDHVFVEETTIFSRTNAQIISRTFWELLQLCPYFELVSFAFNYL